MNSNVVLVPMVSTDVPVIIKGLWQSARLSLTEGDLKKDILSKRVFKAISDSETFGIIILSKEPLTEMTVWLSNKEADEVWAEAIKQAVSLAFSAAEVYKIKWRIAASNKDLLVVADGCGFKNEGTLSEEGPSRGPLITLGLSRNGNQPWVTEKKDAEKDIKIEELTKQLKAACEALDNAEKMVNTEAGLKIEKLTNQLEYAKKEIQRLDAELEKRHRESEEISSERKENSAEKSDASDQSEKIKLGKSERRVLEVVIQHTDGINQKSIALETRIHQSDVCVTVGKLTRKGLTLKEPRGRETWVKPVKEKIAELIPRALQNATETLLQVNADSKSEISQKVKSALVALGDPKAPLTKGISLKDLGIPTEEAEKFVEAVKATHLCHIIGSPKDPENCFIRLKKTNIGNSVEETKPIVEKNVEQAEQKEAKESAPETVKEQEILSKLGQTHREIFLLLKRRGGVLPKDEIEKVVGINKQVCERCIQTLAEHSLTTIDGNNVTLQI